MLCKYIRRDILGSAERTQLPTDGKPQWLLEYEWLDDDNPTFKATPPKSGLNLVSFKEKYSG